MRIFLLALLWFISYAQSSSDCNSSTAPQQVHLSIGFKEHDMVVTWNTQGEAPTAVHYFRGPCSEHQSETRWTTAYGEGSSYGTYTGIVHAATMKNLHLDSLYCYVIGDECRRPQEFRTPAAGKVAFAVYADTGTWGNVNSVLRDVAADTKISMVIHAGDLSYATNDTVWDTWGHLFEPVAKKLPYMIIPGNWDVRRDAITAFLSRFKMPLVNPSNSSVYSYYYSFNHSLVHFVMLSSYDPYDPESAQYTWLENDLKLADTDRERHPWVVISFHSPMYSSSIGHGGSDIKFRKAIEPLLCKYRVDIAFSGHDHGYERTYPSFKGNPITTANHYYVNPSATIHVLAGTGGATTDEWLAYPTTTAHRESSHGYTRVVASRKKLHVTYLRIDGSVGDEFWILREEKGFSFYLILFLFFVTFIALPLCLYNRAVRKIYSDFFTEPTPETSALGPDKYV